MPTEPVCDLLRRSIALRVDIEREIDRLETQQPLEFRFDPALFVAFATAERDRKRRPTVIEGRHCIDLALGDEDLAGLGIDCLPAEERRLAVGLDPHALLASGVSVDAEVFDERDLAVR